MSKLKTYPEAARVISLYLEEFCDKDKDYVNMIADASRIAYEEINRLRSKLAQIQEIIKDAV
jgi:hypothetical protein